MNWIRIATGIYRSDCSVGYLVERKGLGLFQRGWYRSWHLTDNGGKFLGEFESLRKAKEFVLILNEAMQLSRSQWGERGEAIVNQFLTSLHEAAHILVNSLTCNLPFHSATVIQRGDVAGQVRCDAPRNPDAETAKGIIMISIAGDLAQAIALERDFDWRLLDEADKSILTEYGPVLGDGDLEEYVRSITQETAALLKDNSFKLHYLRRTLLRRGKLSGRQIRAVLRRADLYLPSSPTRSSGS